MDAVYLLLGSNEGDRMEWLRRGLDGINSRCGLIREISSIYETAAWGLEDQPSFLNMVVRIETILPAIDILVETQLIEKELGKPKQVKWGQRSLDIDILFYGSQIIDSPELQVPHPYMHQRRFTLIPLAELAPDFIHPVFNKKVSALLEACPDHLEVKKFFSSLG